MTKKPPKSFISIRIDEDVLSFFRSNSPKYQTKINAVLREYMELKLQQSVDNTEGNA